MKKQNLILKSLSFYLSIHQWLSGILSTVLSGMILIWIQYMHYYMDKVFFLWFAISKISLLFLGGHYRDSFKRTKYKKHHEICRYIKLTSCKSPSPKSRCLYCFWQTVGGKVLTLKKELSVSVFKFKIMKGKHTEIPTLLNKTFKWPRANYCHAMNKCLMVICSITVC